jgi:twitching motility protein PilT
MNAKDVLRDFRAAAWRDAAEVQRFVDAASLLEAADLQPCLAVLLDRRAAAEGRAHALRCAVFRRVCEAGEYRGLFVPLVRALRTADPVARQQFVELLPTINHVGGHGELVALFAHHQLEVRQAARDVMASVGGKTAFALLTQHCAEPQFPGRIEAIEALVQLAGYHAIDALRATLAAGTQEEKLQALVFLGDERIITKNREGALSAIAVALDDRTDAVVFAAIAAFAALASEDDYYRYVGPLLGHGNLEVVRAAIGVLGRFATPRTFRVLREQLGLGPKSVRLRVLEVLEVMGAEDGLPVIAEALEHKQIEVRLRAATVLETLAEQGRLDVARTLVWLLRSRDVDVKRIAADLAKRIGDADGTLWPQLLRFLRDEDWWVRERITDALVEMAGSQLTRHAVGMLGEDSPILRRYAVELLMRIRDPTSLGALVRTAGDDEDWWVAERAIEACAEIGDPRAVPYLIRFMNEEPELRFVCVDALARLGDRSAAAPIAALIGHADEELIPTILDALGTLNDPSLVDAIAPLAQHPDYEIRTTARALVGRWKVDAQFQDFQEEMKEQLSTLDRLLWATAKAGGDDLLLGAGRRPYIKRLGETSPIVRNAFTSEQIQGLLYPHLTPTQIAALESGRDVDFSYEVKVAALRFRVNVFQEHSGLSAVFRIVKNVIPAMEALGLPPLVETFGDMRNGLVLVGGPTGAGKSTTLAAVIDYINRKYKRHIITLEDPIEVLHEGKASLINQRELGTHAADFRDALRSTLREDPDVILVGEMRDLETISFAISAAETGHLVFGTVHTASADNSVDRIINAYPFGQQPQVRTILASSLRAVICQYLVPRKSGDGRIPAVEIMLNNEAISNLIRQGKTYQIPNVIAMSRESGMQSMDSELVRLYRAGQISAGDGYMRAVNKQEFEAIVSELEGEGSRTERAVSRDVLTISGGFDPVQAAASPPASPEPPAATSWGSAPSMGSSWSSEPPSSPSSSRLPSGFSGGASSASKPGTPDGRR